MAGYSVNRILYDDTIFTSGTLSPLWTSDGTLSSTNTYEKHSSEGSLVATVEENQTVYYNYDPLTSNPRSNLISTNVRDRNDYVDSFMWVRADTAMSVSLKTRLSYVNIAGIEVEVDSSPTYVALTSGEWYLIRSEGVIVPDDGVDFGISLFIDAFDFESGETEEIFYISHPVIYCRLDFMDNPGVYDIFNRLPLYIKESDMNMSNPTYPLFRFLEIACVQHGDVAKMFEDFIYADISAGYNESRLDTKSVLVNADAVLRYFMPWLAQFVGTRLVNPTVSSTPWGQLPATWQGIDEIDAPALDGDDSVEWAELMEFNPEIVGLEEYLRWQLKYKFFGTKSGSKEAVTGVLNRIITGTKTVNISEGSFTVNIETKISETPFTTGHIVGDSVPEVLELLEHTRPAGIKFTHQLIS